MADSEGDQQQQNETVEEQVPTLKYLEFVHLAAGQAIIMVSKLYDLAKENSGPLKPGVQTVEGTVKTVISPVYDRFHDVPIEMLKIADHKVEGLVHEVSRHVPQVVKEASAQVTSMAQKVPEVAREVRRVGVVETATEVAKAAYTKVEPKAKEMYDQYEPVAEHYAVSAWQKLNKVPLVPEVAQIVLPTAAYWTEKYNTGVRRIADKGCAVSALLPLVPTDKIAKVFSSPSSAPPVS